MGSVSTMMGSGTPAAQAVAIGVGTIETAITATGSTSQANSYGLVADSTEFTTVGANTGARLPANAEVGSQILVFNGGANALLVFPQSGGQINNKTADTGTISIAAGKGGLFVRLTGTKWGSVSD